VNTDIIGEKRLSRKVKAVAAAKMVNVSRYAKEAGHRNNNILQKGRGVFGLAFEVRCLV
jgi:hypothetical protein